MNDMQKYITFFFISILTQAFLWMGWFLRGADSDIQKLIALPAAVAGGAALISMALLASEIFLPRS